MKHTLLILVATFGVATGWAWAQTDSANDTPDKPARDRPTAEEVLRSLQSKRPMNVVLPSQRSATSQQEAGNAMLLPEGAAITKRIGKLEQRGIWWTLVQTTEEGESTIKLLPNRTLDQMVRTHEAAREPMRFSVSGLVTVFDEENFLLPRDSAHEPETNQPAANPTRTPAKPTDGKLAAEDVADRIRNQTSMQSIMAPVSTSAGRDKDRYALASTTLIPGGTPLMARPGRLVRSGDWYAFYFESDHPDNPQPAMKMLPSQTLSLMMEAAPTHTPGLVFLVSGEVTEYRGENYFLARAAMRRIDSGNLSK